MHKRRHWSIAFLGKILIYVIARACQLRKTSTDTQAGKGKMKHEHSPLERQAADALRRARKLPIGKDRNDLRQLALGLRWLHRKGVDSSFEAFRPMSHVNEKSSGPILEAPG